MVMQFNKSAPGSYYRQALAYYSNGTGSFWFAPDNRLSVTDGDPVDFTAFDHLYSGADANGRPLNRNSGGHIVDRVPAFDITGSLSKTLSLIDAFAPPELKGPILQAIIASAVEALEVGQDLAGYRRRGRGGMQLEKVPLTSAVFLHPDSRPALHSDGCVFSDMNSHFHAVVINTGVSDDGTAGSLHSMLLRLAKMPMGATLHAALAYQFMKLGFSIEVTGPNGMFEVIGISPELIEYFSARRNEIKDELEAAGTTSTASPALAAQTAARTRLTKLDQTQEERQETWRAAAIRQGFDPDTIVPMALSLGQVVDERAGEALYRQRLEALAQELVENEAVFNRFDLIRASMAALVGTGLPVSRARTAESELAEFGLVQIGADALGLPIYSTKDMIRTELAVVALAKELATAGGFGLDTDAVNVACAAQGLSPEQADAALAATQDGRLCVIEGAPGTGKSTTLTVPVQCYLRAGKTVLAAATAWKIAKGLGADLGVEAKATAAWLAALKRGEKVFDENTVLVVDETGLMSAADTETLLQAAKQAGAKVILVGDRQQLRPIGAGSGLDLVARAVDSFRIDTIVRQRDEWGRQMVRDFGAGRADAALAALDAHGDVQFAANAKVAVQDIVAHWRSRVEAGVEPLIVARSNAQIRQVAQAIRADCRSVGELGEDLVSFTGRANDRVFAMSLAVGDRIRFNVKQTDLEVVNGTTGIVTAIAQAPDLMHTVVTARLGNREICFKLSELADEKGRVGLSWSYASTIFSSQGLTVDETLVLAEAGFDRSAAYVACSRARNRTTLFVDRSSLETLEQFEPGPPETLRERLTSALANRWARNPKKTSTLDYISPDDWHHLNPGAERPAMAEKSEGPDYV
jgi:conjugative relaxase-like TrwC/TraI family protein